MYYPKNFVEFIDTFFVLNFKKIVLANAYAFGTMNDKMNDKIYSDSTQVNS